MNKINSKTYLTGRLVIENTNNPEFDEIRNFLIILVGGFKELYEKKGMFKVIEECEKSQLSGAFDDITIDTHVLGAGRLFTLRREEASFSFICLDGEEDSKMCWQGFYGKIPDLKNIVNDFIERWNNLDESQIKEIYKYDQPLSMV